MRFHFDEARADNAVKFIKALKHSKTPFRGMPFQLLDWQEILLREIFGWVDDDGYRQYRTVYLEIPKKNGKTELAAAIALKLLVADEEYGAEVYSGANDKEQASFILRAAMEMVRQNRILQKRLTIRESVKRIVDRPTASFYQALSTEAYTKEGLNISGVVIDELHAIKDRDFVDVLTEGASAARVQPLRMFITTAGVPEKYSICYQYHNYAVDVQEGRIPDDRFLPLIFGAGPEENWEDEEVWKKVNPSLGSIIKIEDMREEFIKAQHIPALENTFKRRRLNQWTSQETRFIPMNFWNACSGPVTMTKGRIGYMGIDLSSNTDLSVAGIVFEPVDGIFEGIVKYYMPSDNVRQRVHEDRVPYDVWAREGLIMLTPGNSIDYDFILKDIRDTAGFYTIREIAYDRWGAGILVNNLLNEGFDCIPFGQGFASMSGPTKELLTLILQRKFRHGGHPVLTWNAANVAVRQDPAGNIKPDKQKSTERIDGIVAIIMALDRAMRHEAKKSSIYEQMEMFVV